MPDNFLVDNGAAFDDVYQIEKADVWVGGAGGKANKQGQSIANRTRWLKLLIESVQNDLNTHGNAVDPHPQYFTAAEVNTAIANAVAAVVASSPEALNTLNEFALALANDPNFATTINAALSVRIKFFATGVALPTTNIGPIWHDDYNSLMTWQVFNANGATYTGYASVLIGNLLMDTQPTPRAGYFKSGTANLNRNTYAAVRGWAMHNGIMVAAGTWAAGAIAVCDNADGTTFKAFDVRGEFPRFWDDGRGVDAARAFGSAQLDQLQTITGALSGVAGSNVPGGGAFSATTNRGAGTGAGFNVGNYIVDMQFSSANSARSGAETRSRNTAFLASIKF
jgi:hypothetical protein